MNKKYFNFALLFLVSMCLALQTQAVPGDLDPTFGTGGKLTTDFGNHENGNSAALQSDGKIVVVGRAFANFGGFRDNFAVARYNTDGTLDTSFDGDGKVITPVGTGNAIAYSVAIQADGKIVVAGVGRTDGNEFAVVRYNSDGSLDTTFDGDGKVLTNITDTFNNQPINSQDDATEVLIQTNGKIIVIGNTALPIFGLAAVRYNSDGSLDTSFGNSGIKTLQYFSSSLVFRNLYATSSALQTNGKIVIGGYVNIPISFDFVIIRLNSDGSPDTSFGFNYSETPFMVENPGFTLTPIGTPSFNDEITDIAVQNDGKIVVVGRTYRGNIAGEPVPSRFAIARLNTNGTLDSGFENDGIVITPYFISEGSDGDGGQSLVIQSDDKIVVGGNADSAATNGSNADFALARYNSNGTLDNTFGQDGKVMTPFNITIGSATIRGNESANELLLQNDGKIVAVGTTAIGAPNDFALARYNNDSTTNNTNFDFDGDSKTDIGIFRPAPSEWWYLRSSDGANRAFQFGSSTDKIVPADYTGDGKTDLAFYRPTSSEWFVLRSEDFTFYGFQFGTSGDKPAPGDFDRDGKADPAVFRPSQTAWYIANSSGGTTITQFGVAEDIPQVNDYDGDGKADLAVFRPTPAEWWIRSSSGQHGQSLSIRDNRR